MSTITKENLPDRIRAIRAALGEPGHPLPQPDLAKRLGVSRATIGRWEQGVLIPTMPLVIQAIISLEDDISRDTKK